MAEKKQKKDKKGAAKPVKAKSVRRTRTGKQRGNRGGRLHDVAYHSNPAYLQELSRTLNPVKRARAKAVKQAEKAEQEA